MPTAIPAATEAGLSPEVADVLELTDEALDAFTNELAGSRDDLDLTVETRTITEGYTTDVPEGTFEI